jgi:aminoglycoside phosphotransferase family enzyme
VVEHIWMGPPVRIIDRLEFSADFRRIDWLDELAFLEVETERLGAPRIGRDVRRRVCARLHDPAPEALRLFYRSSRALLRARLAIAHLLEPEPRTPEKWPRQARAYLAIAQADAERLARRM